MRRSVLALMAALVITALVAAPTPAFAETDRDPNDVQGPLDLRRISAHFRFRGQAQLLLVIAFYPDFNLSAIPHRREAVQGKWDIFVGMSQNFVGFFFRRGRRHVIYRYGDFGSGAKCCFDASVRKPGSNTLKVVVRHLPTFPFRVRAFTSWPENGVIQDRTGILRLGRPPQS